MIDELKLRMKLSNIQLMLSSRIKVWSDKLESIQGIIDDYDDYDDYLDSLYDIKHDIQDKIYIYNEILRDVNRIIKGGD